MKAISNSAPSYLIGSNSPDMHCNPGRLQAGVERLASRKTSLGREGRFLFQGRESLCFTS